ncbi:MAG: hypothetical protein HKO48_03610 [Nitrosopumilus sp.]|nr:hypothetical protein [Nitrosopumilus sp.]NNL37520.1 hypothetical protein [Nitrosopumilus sp.]NNM36184.1 hypothetical protein [Nitrosopumilus sp.]
MHCDDKRTLYVLKEEIKKRWKLLEKSGFTDQQLLEEFSISVSEYFEYKTSSE